MIVKDGQSRVPYGAGELQRMT